jgi:hypothetical protein
MISCSVRISAKAKRVTLQRWLLARIVFDTEEFTLTDLCCLFENQIWLEKKVQTDPEFSSKFGSSLEELSVILKEINFRMEYSSRALVRFREKLKNQEEFLLPKRNYLSLKPTMKGLFSLEPSSPLGKLIKTIPPKARIGIGYRDKGSARDLAYDGSPRWQEVAAHRGPLYNSGVPDEGLSNSRTDQILTTTILLTKIGRRRTGKRSNDVLRAISEDLEGKKP